MKHIKALIAALIVFSVCGNVFAYDCEVDGIYYNRLSSDEFEVTYGTNKYAGDVVIPETVTYRDKVFKVVQIGIYAFSNCTSLTSVSLPQSVNLLKGTFKGCSSLTSISLSSSLSSLPEECFSGCSSLASISIPESVITIGASAFRDCKALSTIEIPEGVTSISNYVFYGCSTLNDVHLPNGINIIGWGAFKGCSSLTSIIIPENLELLNGSAFEGCSSLTSITLPNNTTRIEENAFKNCSNLSSISLSCCLTSIFQNAFEGCVSLTSVKLPNGLDHIGRQVFSGCSNLQTVSIPQSVAYIGDDAFHNCIGLKKVIISDIPSWCRINFATAESNPLHYAQHLYSDEDTEIKELYLDPSITSIGDYAFFRAENISSIYISVNLDIIIHPNTFGNTIYTWSDLYAPKDKTEYYTTSNNWKNFKSIIGYDNIIDGICYGMTSSSTAQVIGRRVASSFLTIPEFITMLGKQLMVTSIASRAFLLCSSLTSITIPSSVISIGGDAFEWCSGLATIVVSQDNPKYDSREKCNAIIETKTNTLLFGCKNTIIPNSVTSIGEHAFRFCSDLTSITIPNSVTSIGDAAFDGCSGLTSITIPGSVVSIGGNAFGQCSDLATIVVSQDNPQYDSREKCNAIIETKTNTLLFGCKNTIIPNSVTSIGDAAFWGCSGLTSIIIPKSVTEIGDYAFRGCSITFVISLNMTPPMIYDYVFDSYTTEGTLFVPTGSKKAYQNAEYWKDFKNVIEIDPTDVHNITLNNNDKDTPIYDLSGRKLKSPHKGIVIKEGKKYMVK